MSNINVKKERNTHDRVRKRIVLIITDDPGITVREAASRLRIDPDNTMVRILCTFLKGKSLENAVKLYIRDNMIRLSSKDEVLYWNKNEEGGDADDCDQSG
ncbi:MAG: hypothetical protein J5476_00595 [Lachnospiraceae bacterium]|nr:hypothetical protein [Lachnospiraceae bacterium]